MASRWWHRAGTVLLGLLVWLVASSAHALTCTSIGTGLNWGNAATWTSVGNCNRVPTNADDVIIANGHTITVDIAGAVAGSVTIAAGNAASALNLGGAGTTLTVTNAGGLSGNITINGSIANFTKSLAVGTRTLTVTGNVTINGGATTGGAANIAQLSVGNTPGVANIGGNLIINAGSVDTSVARATVATGTLNVTGDVTVTGGITSNTRDALLSVTGASAPGAGVNIGGALNVVSSLAGTSTVTLGTGSRITVNGAGGVNNEDRMTIGAGTFSVTNAAATLTISDPAIVSVASVTSGTLSVAGNVVVSSGAVGASSMTVTTGVITIAGSLGVTAATSGASNTGDATASVTGANGRIDVTGDVTVTGGVAAGQVATLSVTASSIVGRGVNIGGSLGIVSSRAGTSTVTLGTGSRVTVNGAGGVTNEDTMTIGAGIFSLTNASATLTNASPTVAASITVTTGTLSLAGSISNGTGETLTFGSGPVSFSGSFTNNGTFNAGTATVTLNGAAAQTITGSAAITFSNVTVTNAANPNVTLGTNVVVSNTLTGTVTLTTTCPTDYTFTSSGPTVLHSCPAAPTAFNACSGTDSCPTSTGKLYTRIANRAFAVYLAALKSDGSVETNFNGSATVSLVGRIASGGALDGANCPSGAVDRTEPLGSLAFTSGKRTQVGITMPNFYRDVRVKFVCDATNCPPSGITVCSSDNFAVRPDDLALAVTITSPLKAGDVANGDTFSISATAKANASDTTTYTGSPVVDVTKLAAASSGPNNTGVLDGSFGAGVAGVSSGSFGYSEVGYFTVAANGVYDTVAAIDASPAQCTDDFNNTYAAATPSATVGCKFGNQSPTGNIGRFTPASFVSLTNNGVSPVIPSVTPFCGSGATGFTYAGQSQLRVRFSLEARNTAGTRTQNYDVSYAGATGVVQLLAENADNNTNLAASFDHGLGTWSAGRYIVNSPGKFARADAMPPSGPFETLEIGVRVKNTANTADGDEDGIKITPENMAVAGLNGLKLPVPGALPGNTTTRILFGRLRLMGAYGSEKLQLRVPLRAEYYDGGAWKLNTADSSCTSIATNDVTIGNRNPGDLGSSPTSVVQRSGGLWDVVLAVPAKVGTADVALDLGTGTAASDVCLSSWTNGPTPATAGSGLTHFLGLWCGAGYDKAPLTRIRFGSPKAPYIYLRERY